MNWFTSHLGVISTLVSIATLLVWIFYAQLLYIGLNRSERPLLLIHQAHGNGMGSYCLVANLSRQPLHVLGIELRVRTQGEHEARVRLHDYQRITGDDESDWAAENVMKEGPLKQGDFLALGSFKSMISASRQSDRRSEAAGSEREQKLADRAHELEIRVVALFSSFKHPVGASRRFDVVSTGDAVYLRPVTPLTRQWISYRERRAVHQWLQEWQS